jgi:hypothetical protein
MRRTGIRQTQPGPGMAEDTRHNQAQDKSERDYRE